MKFSAIFMATFGLALVACGGSSSDVTDVGGDGGITPPTAEACSVRDRPGILYCIEPGEDATTNMLVAMIEARPGDTIEFTEGYFELTSGLQLSGTEDIVVRGQGMDKTVLSFKNSTSQEGFLATTVNGVVVQDLTVLDSPGDAFKLQGVDHGTLSRVRAFWSSGRKTDDEESITAENYTTAMSEIACTDPATENPANANPLTGDSTSPDYTVSILSGRYGIYPVNSQNILVENSESIGASDAGIYVGQTDNAIIRDSKALFNVFGFEIENVRGGEYSNNLAECNTGGFLVYDLDGLTRYGSKTRMFGNTSRNNNTYNFAEPGSLVSNVPRGSGMITLAYDQLDIFNNTFENNGIAGIIHTSYELFGDPGDRRLDMYSEGLHIFDNTFINNGNDIAPPDIATILATQGDQLTSVLPPLLALKNLAGGDQYRGAHIAWDGYFDVYDPDCPYPVDGDGQPIPQDEDGKPIQGNQYPNPDCRYNAYKFDDEGNRLLPKWWYSCIDSTNNFADDSLAFANFHGLDGLQSLFALLEANPEGVVTGIFDIPGFPSSLDLTPHDCVAEYGENMKVLPPVVIPPFERSGEFDPAPSQARIDQLCNATPAIGEINAAAFEVNCPDLAQYNLFSDAADPMSLPNGQGLPFVLNSKLFSDYSTKYRVAYIPEGSQARYLDGEDSENAAILFPVGTIIAKTFAFADEDSGNEDAIETRLLIKRETTGGMLYWSGLEYIWQEQNGQKVALLSQGGGVAEVSWDYTDTASDERYTGSTNNYLLPNANQCQSCHANDGSETGAAPIGPKIRNMNRPYSSESPIAHGIDQHPVAGMNQVLYWCQNGFMTNCPDGMVADPTTQYVTSIERNAKFNVPGDAGFTADSAQDIEARVRSYLEVNCAHCHNARGLAQNTGFYLDVFREVNDTFGICKGPTAAGTEGRGGREFDIVPGSAPDSILPYRLGPEATSLAARMPPIARSAVHQQAFDLVTTWINDVVDDSYDNADACGGDDGGFGGLPTCAPGEIPGIGGECLPGTSANSSAAGFPGLAPGLSAYH
ncbi:MAG: parallel beta-helix domain-containing protein [Oceanococcus sp.]